jgi:hypothetical protein
MTVPFYSNQMARRSNLPCRTQKKRIVHLFTLTIKKTQGNCMGKMSAAKEGVCTVK